VHALKGGGAVSAAKTITKVRVSRRAVISRLNIKLAKNGQRLHKARGKTAMPNEFAGQYFIVHEHTNTIIDHSFGLKRLEYLARKHKALQAWEEMV
jgi:hypothetical protein